MHQSKHNKTDHKTHFISGANCYMFRYQGAIIWKIFSKNNVWT